MFCAIVIALTLTSPYKFKSFKMSYFPSPVLVRLQELRLWQGNYDSILQNKSKDGTHPSDYETIEGLSALDTTQGSNNSSPLSTPGRNGDVDWDQKTISPSKPFEQLLEEQLAEDTSPQVAVRQKRPFLKKGAGLVRYKLKERSGHAKCLKKPVSKVASDHKVKERQPVASKKCPSAPIPRKSCLKNTQNAAKETETDFTPLKAPDVAIKPKATWHKVDGRECEEIAEESKKNSNDAKTPKHTFNSHIIGKINNFALRHFLPNNTQKSPHKNHDPDYIEAGKGSESSFEKNSENELRIFEALEERANDSSFSSTNSSIIRLLSSTPNKIKMPKTNSPILEENKSSLEQSETSVESDKEVAGVVDKKQQELNVKNDVLHEFLRSLRRLGAKPDSKRHSNESHHSGNEKCSKITPDTSFSDEDKWSSNTDGNSPSQSPSSGYTEYDTTYKGDGPTRVDVAINTTFSDEEESKNCRNCGKLEVKLEKLSKQIPDIKAEKARVCDFAKDLEKKRDQLNKEMQMMRKKQEEELNELREELSSERKKSARDKMVYDVYVKDSQNRPSRKEREEVLELKKELVDVKELMKLKDTKNGSTQARLRNQIRQLEKENNEYKAAIEKLQKQNAKLTATQKVRTPSEVKMLHEINKNLTKLTEETLKNNLSKSDKCSISSNNEEVMKTVKLSKETFIDNKDKERSPPKMKKKHSSSLKNKYPLDGIIYTGSDETSHNITPFANLSLEKQYENVFGQVSSPAPSPSSPSDIKRERIEKVFEDGSKEIKYSNGNSKTISPDGNLILVKYYNGDVKETNLLENILKYYYAENQTWHTQFGDGTELLEYPSGQKEKKYKDGKKEIMCADGSRVIKMPDGTEEILSSDGSKIIIKNVGGERILFLPNGQKEIHSKDHKRREYPDGTIKILFPDGTQETRYASGRIRVKDSNGILIMDSHNAVS